MSIVSLVFLVAALVLFVLAAFRVPVLAGKFDLLSGGLACFTFAALLQHAPLP